jgi:enoyl-CoA hydratase/carnithine racemase
MEQVGPALSVTDHESVRRWTMQLAPVNAINAELLDAFEAALDDAERDQRVAAVVLDSSLKVFSAGADATWMAQTVQDIGLAGLLAEFNATMDRFRAVCLRLRQAPFVVIAALDGHALAGGLELAAACDLRFCADSDGLRLGVPEMDLFGCLPSGGGGAQFLARLLGPSRALEFILTATPISPARGFEIGLVDRLCPAGQAGSAALEFAVSVAGKAGRIGVASAKQAVFGLGELPLSAALPLDGALHWDTMRRGNFLAGAEAFAERYASGTARAR